MIDLNWDEPSEELSHRHLSESETNEIEEISKQIFPLDRRSDTELEGRRENGCFVYESPGLVAGMFIDGQSGESDTWLYRVGAIREDLGGWMEPPQVYDETIAEGFSSTEEAVRGIALFAAERRVENAMRARAHKQHQEEMADYANQLKNNN